MTLPLYRELSFAQWSALARKEKRSIVTRQWNPARPELGESTRGAILEGFGDAYPHLRRDAVAGTAYFSRVGWSIAVLVSDPAVRVPRRFDVFPVIKGITRNPDDPWTGVKWLSR